MNATLTKSRYLGIVTVLAVSACGGDPPDGGGTEQEPSPAQQSTPQAIQQDDSAYRVVEVANGGAIRGTVQFTGTVPAAQTRAVSDDVVTCGATKEVSSVWVGPDKGLRDAVVSLTDITQGAAAPTPPDPPTLDQNGCEFIPHVLIASVGATVNVLNNDPISHNIHTAAFENRPVNLAQPAELHSVDLSFDFPEKVRVRCDIHEWMSAWVVVVEHPYHAVTDASGGFALEDVPPGTYTMEVWHGEFGSTTQQVTVTAGGTLDVNVQITSSGQ